MLRWLTPRLVVGATVLLLGLASLLEELGTVDEDVLSRWWPLGVALTGVAILVQGGSRIAGAVLVGLGGWWLGESLALVDLDVGELWPLVLVAIGLFLVYRALSSGTETEHGAEVERAGRVRAMGIFSTVRRKIVGRLESGDATAFFGGCEIDLTEAELGGGPTLDLLAICGGIEVWVRPDCGVSGGPIAFMGGYADETTGIAPASEFIRLRGFTMWGGIEVKSRPFPSRGEKPADPLREEAGGDV